MPDAGDPVVPSPGPEFPEAATTTHPINAALLAKIHTVEWTPAILGHPALQVAMRANWWGFQEERLSRVFGRLSDNEIISGIPGHPIEDLLLSNIRIYSQGGGTSAQAALDPWDPELLRSGGQSGAPIQDKAP